MNQSRRFDHSPESVPAARRFATEFLKALPAEILDVVALMVSELASNCIRHTGSGFDLTIRRTDSELIVEATDQGGGEPTVSHPAPDDPSGRGLQIVSMLSAAWGVEHLSGDGKKVWFSLDLQGPAGAQTAHA